MLTPHATTISGHHRHTTTTAPTTHTIRATQRFPPYTIYYAEEEALIDIWFSLFSLKANFSYASRCCTWAYHEASPRWPCLLLPIVLIFMRFDISALPFCCLVYYENFFMVYFKASQLHITLYFMQCRHYNTLGLYILFSRHHANFHGAYHASF